MVDKGETHFSDIPSSSGGEYCTVPFQRRSGGGGGKEGCCYHKFRLGNKS